MDDWEQRVARAREANVALYLDDPNPESVYLLVVFESAVVELRGQRQQDAERREREGGAG